MTAIVNCGGLAKVMPAGYGTVVSDCDGYEKEVPPSALTHVKLNALNAVLGIQTGAIVL